MKLANINALIVDDDPATLRLLGSALLLSGLMQITRANDGLEAHQIVTKSEKKFDLIICDWMMPKMDGLAFLQRFRLKQPDTTFIMLTSKSNADDFQLAREMGVDFFFMKPLSAGDLSVRFKAVLGLLIEDDNGSEVA